VQALGYDMNSMEWAVRDGIPYAIDFMNPAPDMDVYSLTPHYFDWAVNAMADMAIDLAKNPRRQVRDLRWDALFAGSREGGGNSGSVVFGGMGGGGHTGGDASAQGGGGGGHIGEGGTASADAGGGFKGSGGRQEGGDDDATQDARGTLITSGGATQGGGGGGHVGEGGTASADAGNGNPQEGDDARAFADAAHAVPPEPALGETAGGGSGSGDARNVANPSDAARTGEDTSPGAAGDSTQETA
jgi:hypothetical protein